MIVVYPLYVVAEFPIQVAALAHPEICQFVRGTLSVSYVDPLVVFYFWFGITVVLAATLLRRDEQTAIMRR
jgi:hypothetical protein